MKIPRNAFRIPDFLHRKFLFLAIFQSYGILIKKEKRNGL